MRTLRLEVLAGDVLEQAVDVLICTGNPLLRMTGGVNGALLQRGALGVQRELERYLQEAKRTWVPPGTVVRTGPGPLAVSHILHAVAIDGFYRTDRATVVATLRGALRMAASLGARTVATPALATGYGPLTIEAFAAALREALTEDFAPIEELRLVLRRASDVETAARVLADQPSSR